MIMWWLPTIAAGALGWFIAKDSPALAWTIILGVLLATILLIGAPGLGAVLVLGLLGLVGLYVFIRLLPFLIGLALGMVFLYALIIGIGHLARYGIG
jgi:hypothetical protein